MCNSNQLRLAPFTREPMRAPQLQPDGSTQPCITGVGVPTDIHASTCLLEEVGGAHTHQLVGKSCVLPT